VPFGLWDVYEMTTFDMYRNAGFKPVVYIECNGKLQEVFDEKYSITEHPYLCWWISEFDKIPENKGGM